MTKTSPRTSRPRKKASSPSVSRKKQKSVSSSKEPLQTSSSRTKISYEKNGRTDRIINWLTDNVNDRTRLFSDNVQDASAEGRRIRTAKTSKMIYYRKIAAAVFENDPERAV